MIKLLNNFDLPIGNYKVITSYGKIDGNLVIIDYGLNKQVYKTHYEEPRKRAAEKRRNKQYKFHEVSAKLEGVIN